jgi:hypothetical protein
VQRTLEHAGAGQAVHPRRSAEQRGQRAIESVEAFLVEGGGDRPGEQQAIAPTQLGDQAQDGAVAGEPVVVVLLERPVPARFFESGRQAADLVAGLVLDDVVTGSRQVIRRRQPAGARADDGDVHAAGSAATSVGSAATSACTFVQSRLSRAK